MDLALGVVPIHVHPNVAHFGPIDGADIVFVENFGKMVGVFFANIFYAKVIDAEGEGDGAPIVLPEAWRGRALMVAMFVESFFELILGEDAGLQEALHALLDLDVDSAIRSRDLFEVKYLDKFGWYIFELHAHVLGTSHGSVEMKIFEIHCAVAGTFGLDDHVDNCRADIAKNVDEVAPDCKLHAVGVFLFGAVVDTDASVGGVAAAIGKDLFALDEDNCVGAFADTGDALR